DAGETALDVIVTANAGPLSAAKAQESRSDRGTAEVRYSSATRELQNSVSVTRESKTMTTEASVRVVHHAEQPAGDRARTSIPSASLRFFTRKRELTLLDREVDHSPLTLAHTPVRGIHYLDERWRLHAGYTAYATYQSFLVPLERQLVFGGGYAIRAGRHARVVPGAFVYDGRGTVLSMLYDYDDGERLAARGEVGYSGGFGIAAQLGYVTARDQARADVRYRGDDFAVPSVAQPRGLLADTAWTHQYGLGSTFAAAFQATNVAGTRAVAASADAEHRLSDRYALTGGATYGSFDGRRSVTVPAGIRLDSSRGSLAALYRYARSDENRGGHGFRIAARTSVGRMHLSAYADRQQLAPTLDVIFGEHPELALALGELGIVATTPGDVARALREHAELIELGYIEGVTIDFAPSRLQLGAELTFLGSTAARHQLRARFVRSVVERVASRRTSILASLAYSRRLTAATDLYASYTWWRTVTAGEEPHDTPFLEIGLRQRFDGLPSLPGFGGTISGEVFVDENLDGVDDGTPVVAEVVLDGARTQRTGEDGTFTFANVPRGAHRITARVPDHPDAYFTTPSRVEVETGDRVAFGVAFTPARLQGRVVSDAGDGIGGVRVLLSRGTTQLAATTGSDGAYAIAAPPGEWQVSLVGGSVPSGYAIAGTDARTVRLERATPVERNYELRAHRTVTGTGAAPLAELEVRPSGKRVRADEQGRFSIRSLPAGEVTIVVNGVAHRLTLSTKPETKQLDLAPAVAAAESVRTQVHGERRDAMRWVVAIGAFRVHANAVATVARAREQGVEARLDDRGSLTVVEAGPYATRAEADVTAARLTRAGIEAIVVSGK
ncbi:MAG TPA: SPOR domain-containing protein, partial [Thermoanaerobaculia bacterium]|nr:SPOR domain-containing protein [Thermoanaerobaculia bacterium]